MVDWMPRGMIDDGGPRYLQIVAAIEHDIASGVLSPGTRLPPQRSVAEHLGISVATVSKAYDQAQQRGLVSGEVGRGTFVLGIMPKAHSPDRPREGRRLNLALNAPPDTGSDALIAQALKDIADQSELKDLLAYLPHQGTFQHRDAVQAWLKKHAMPAHVDDIVITHGAQHAIAIALGLLVSSGEMVLAENLTYSGMRALAVHENYRLGGVAMDEHGLIPEQLDRAFAETGARVLFCMPTLQTPTASTMTTHRREQILEVIRAHNAYLVEDDAYGFLCDPAIPPLSRSLPERSFYIVSFAKCLVPGLRIGAMVVPPAFRDRCINGLRSTGWMATPIMAEVVSRLINAGHVEEQVKSKRAIAARRHSLAMDILGKLVSVRTGPPGFHIWLKMPAGRTTSSLITQCAMAGVTIAGPEVLRSFDPMSNGVRLCLGTPETDADVEFALLTVRRVLDSTEVMSFV
jgi:DNA-binding transcriptional MocR family regulator